MSLEHVLQQLARLDSAILDGKEEKNQLHGRVASIVDYLSSIQSKERDLTTQVEILRSELAGLSRENADFKSQFEASKQSSDTLHPDAAKILKFYYEQTEPMAIGWVAQGLGIHASEGEAHAEDLYQLEFLGLSGVGDSAIYHILPAGTKYVMKHKL